MKLLQKCSLGDQQVQMSGVQTQPCASATALSIRSRLRSLKSVIPRAISKLLGEGPSEQLDRLRGFTSAGRQVRNDARIEMVTSDVIAPLCCFKRRTGVKAAPYANQL